MGKYIQKFTGLLSLLLILSITNGNAQTNVSGVISTNTTWTKAGSPYILTANILVNTGISLTIEPGASVKVNENYGITINGTLIANGNSTDSIYFLNNISNKKWSGITFTSSSVSSNIDISDNYIDGSILNYVSISSISSSNGAVYLVNNALLIKNSSIFNNSSNGIYFDYNGSFTFDKIIIKGCKISNNDGSGVSYNGYRMQGTLKVLNNLISNNSGNGITTGGGDAGGSHVNIFSNNDIISNGGVGIIANANGTQTLSYNLIYLNSNGIYSRGNGTYTISKNRIISNIGYALNCIYTTHIINNNIVFGNNGGVLFSQGGDYTINNNSFINNNYFAKSNGSWTSPINIHHNLISKNKSKTENLITTFQPESGTPDFKINNNNIVYNDYTYLIYNNRNITGNSIDAANNYWGTTNLSSVQNLIYDFNLNSSKSVVTISPLTSSIITSSPITDVKDVTKNLTGSGIVLTWSANTESDVSGYKIYYGGYTGYSYTNSVDVGNVTSTTVSAGIGIDENFAVTAYDASKDGTDDQFDGNESWYSTANKIPNAPSNLAAVSSGHKVKLNWDVSTSSGVNNYNIYRSTDGVSFTKLISTTNNTYTNTGLTAYTKYYYKVAAFDSLDLSYDGYGIESALSSAVNAIPTNSFYVDSAIGNDITGIGSSALPYKKISTAINAAIAGDTILVERGTYLDNLVLTKELTIIALNTQKNTILKPLLPNSQIVNFTSGSNSSKLSGFTLTGGGNVRGSAIDCNFSSPTIERCIITNSGGEAPIRYYYSDAVINNCLIYKNMAGGVFFYDPIVAAPRVNHSTIVYNAGIGTGSSNTSVIPVFTNCIIYGNSSGTFSGNISILNSIIQGVYPGNETNINANPKFIDSSLNDYRLQDYSPAIGLGTVIPGINKDFDGNSKPLPSSSNPDAGAYENNFGHPAPFINTDSSRNGIILLKMTQTPVGTVNKINIYKGLSASPTTKYKDTVLVSKFIDSINTVFNKVIYYRLTSVGASNVESGYSNEVRTISFTPPSLYFPVDLSIKADTSINFQWGKIDNATNYKLQYSTDSNFISNVIELTKSDTFNLKNGLFDNTTYFWRVQTLDSVHYSKWSNFKRFQTLVRNPILNTITTVNRVITINWNVNSLRNIKAFKIYRGTGTNPTTKIDSISSLNLTYSDTITNGIKYYYRVTAVNTDNVESSFSNELNANSYGVTLLDSPSNNRVKEVLTPTFKWQTIEYATNYNIQISSDSLFSNFLLDTISSLTSLSLTKKLSDNTIYYWRVRAGDSKGYGNWTNKSSFQTLITPPLLLSILPGNKVDTLKWTIGGSKNIKYFKIYSDTVTNPTKLKDSISGLLDTYIDKANLLLNVKYFYRIVAGNQENIESDFSNILSVVPINSLPKAIKLVNKTIQNAGEFNFVKLSYSSSGSIDTDGKISSFNWYVNDSLVNKTDSILNYFFKLGTNSIKLTVIDNDGGKDSSTSVLNLSSLQKVFPAGILGGISAINPNYILTADTSFNNTTGSSVSILDRSGNTIFPIVVQSKIFTTPSISSDTSIFITNGSSLNGYSKSGVSLWPTIPLGGISYVTPTIDSNFNRIYVGVSNKNFFAYDYKTGKNVWSIICDAPINTSAVITGDRKLIFTSQAGTLYGFDISKSDIQTTPKWKMSFGDIITKSPAVDASSNIYVGTNAGRLIKFMLNTDGSVSVKWNVSIGSAIQTSPVIDADSNIYVGTEKGDFYKINRFNGSTIWSYNVGAAISSTPNISEYGTIYVSNMNGLVTAISTDKRVLWKYQDNGPISANSLYINNILYIASEKGSFTGIYDNPNSVNVNTSISSTGNSISGSVDNISTSKILNSSSTYISNSTNFITPRMPVWGTFQGDYRRTGSLSLICPSILSISRAANGNLISNTPNYIQWYKDGSEILNATDSIFKPTLAGNYSIKNNQAGCNTVSSNSYYYLVTDIVNLNKEEFIKLTPNPFINFMNIDFVVKGQQRLNIEVFSASTGAKVAVRIGVTAGSRLVFNELNPGIYFVRVASPDMKVSHQFKMVKL